MIFSVGITGGIGSGKSTVSKVFETLGIPVYYADAEAKKILQEDPEIRAQLITLFGPETFSRGLLNRNLIAEKVFSDASLLTRLNELVHPKTIENAHAWMNRQTTPYAVKEAALIFESGSQAHLDHVIGIYAPTALRIHRTMQRDNITREAVLARMKRQIDENIKMKLCHSIIVNDEQQLVIPQVIALHEKLLKLAEEKMEKHALPEQA